MEFDEVIKGIIQILLTIILFIKNIVFNKERVLKGKYLHFKTIRKEYFWDKINGYFALQQYFNRYLSVDEMEHIINSPNSYKIFTLLKAAWGKYEFINDKFIPKVKIRKYIIPFIGYFIACILLSIQIIFSKKIITETDECFFGSFLLSIYV